MRALRRFLALSRDDRILVARSAMVLMGIWLGLRLFSFKAVLEAVDRPSRRMSYPNRCSRPRLDRIVWAVLAVSWYWPLMMNCLAQALAAKVMLKREGYRTLVRIGVATSESAGLSAHAWLEYNGEVILGGAGSEDFHALPCFQRGPS
ncbi:MAG TPA: lasso peptide biosynthesis B2 protein [Desulfomonilaceae bacterium]|nr:lasso peptide biosynthesis B2 protein [Desulfomonilaceae bacterium]